MSRLENEADEKQFRIERKYFELMLLECSDDLLDRVKSVLEAEIGIRCADLKQNATDMVRMRDDMNQRMKEYRDRNNLQSLTDGII